MMMTTATMMMISIVYFRIFARFYDKIKLFFIKSSKYMTE